MGKKKSIKIDLNEDMMDLAVKFDEDHVKYLIDVVGIRKFILLKDFSLKIVIKVEDKSIFSYKKIRTDFYFKEADLVELNIKKHRWARPIEQFISSCIISPSFRSRYEYSAEEFDKAQKELLKRYRYLMIEG